MRRLLVIGIGAGDPAFVTMQAVEAMHDVDVFLVIDKGAAKDDLVAVRQEVLRRYVTRPHRVVTIDEAPRDPDLPYREAVARWHDARTLRIEQVLSDEVADDGCAGILVWGDPSLYDSTLRIVDEVLARGRVAFHHTVVPGISSLQVLAARHRIPLNQVGRPVHVTTGRLLQQGIPEGVDDIVVMLDGDTAFTGLVGQGFEIYWGAYLGSPGEILLSGPLDEVADEIVRVRAEARGRKGWIFDTYLLRRPAQT